MESMYERLTKIFSEVESLRIASEIFSIGLESEGEYYSLSVLDVHHNILLRIEKELQDIITDIEKESMKE